MHYDDAMVPGRVDLPMTADSEALATSQTTRQADARNIDLHRRAANVRCPTRILGLLVAPG